VPPVTYVRSEQNFQSDAQSTLRLRVADVNRSDRANGVYRFRFKTLFNPDRGDPATAIEYNIDPQTGGVDVYLRRELGHEPHPTAIYRVHEGFYDNGTIRTYTRLNDEEVSTNITCMEMAPN
jgi:hypothetical protein